MDIYKLYNDFLNDFSLYRRVGTIESYNEHSKEFLDRFNKQKLKKLKQVNQDFINNYIRDLKNRNLSNTSINKKIYSIVVFYKWLLDKKLIKQINFTYKKLEEIEKPIYALTTEQLKQFIEYIPKRCLKQRLIFLLLLTTGIRRNELINIKIANIDFKNNRIFLDFTKTHKARYCFMSDTLKRLIIDYLNETKHNKTTYLFCTYNGFHKISGTYITQMFHYAKTALGFEISANIMRHTYATYLLKNGANIEELRALMGHSDYRITKRYVQHLTEELQTANNNFNVLKNIKKEK